jgi:hypothetical protein
MAVRFLPRRHRIGQVTDYGAGCKGGTPFDRLRLWPPRPRRELFLDHGCVFVEVPRLMTDDELAAVFERFVQEVPCRSPKAATPTPESPPSTLPAFRKRKTR